MLITLSHVFFPARRIVRRHFGINFYALLNLLAWGAVVLVFYLCFGKPVLNPHKIYWLTSAIFSFVACEQITIAMHLYHKAMRGLRFYTKRFHPAYREWLWDLKSGEIENCFLLAVIITLTIMRYAPPFMPSEYYYVCTLCFILVGLRLITKCFGLYGCAIAMFGRFSGSGLFLPRTFNGM